MMKKYMLLVVVGLLCIGCNGQNNEHNKTQIIEKEHPKGSWKVDKEFDEQGNLIKYDSIYSWSSSDISDGISTMDHDSLMQRFKSKFFSQYSKFQDDGFDSVFSEDSLFSQHFFNDDFFGSDFGTDLMDLDKIREDLLARQKKFLEKYQSEFVLPEDEKE